MKSSVYNKLKSQIEKVAWITFFWILVSLSQVLRGYLTLNQFNCVNEDQSVFVFLQGAVITGLAAGLIGGSTTVFFWENWLRTKPYGRALLSIALSFTLIFIVVALISGLYFNANQLGVPLFSEELWEAQWAQFFSFDQIFVYLSWMSVVIITLVALSVNDKYGPGVFKSFILGEYFHPKREERIFMFLDLRGSTTIAEKLGEEKYFSLLKDLFSDVTPAILNSKGQIYQYVGDEIVISWEMDSGTKNSNCLQCFFDIKQRLLDKAKYYLDKYDGLTPQFKAGLHYGNAMVGEIGVVKRDIVYSGDVLNTTARIQSKCNELGKDILLSKYLLEKLEPLPKHFKSIALGKLQLRGKQESVMLYTV